VTPRRKSRTMELYFRVHSLVCLWLVPGSPPRLEPLGGRFVMLHLKKFPSYVPCQSTSLRPAQVALSRVAVPLCKGGAGVREFSRPANSKISRGRHTPSPRRSSFFFVCVSNCQFRINSISVQMQCLIQFNLHSMRHD
jgi:hypothetical protein